MRNMRRDICCLNKTEQGNAVKASNQKERAPLQGPLPIEKDGSDDRLRITQ
jgi:hypothetical protein